ncbi:hypothetical protein [Pseudoalteromonas phage PH357]|nr:hypothetical protein [Pseudoalteromonas phage PH357]
MEKITFGKVVTEKVKVLHQDVNSDGGVIYACKRYSDNRLLWVGECDLEEVALNKLTPLQEDFLASEKKFINIIACGKGAGTTTAFLCESFKRW